MNFNLARETVRKNALAKLDNPKHRWTYCHFPDGIDSEKAILKMKKFISGKDFDQFYDRLSHIMSDLTETDLQTIGISEPSKTAKEFLQLFDDLEAFGFYNFKETSRCFWSGAIGREKASTSSHLDDSKIPAIILGFDICTEIQNIEMKNKQKLLFTLFPNALSSAFASQAKGDVFVYISNDVELERSSFQIGNNFWNSELPALQRLFQQGKVSRILVCRHRQSGWSKPIDINSIMGPHLLPIRRRTAYFAAPIEDTSPSIFCPLTPMSGLEYQRWAKTRAVPRPELPLSIIKKFVIKLQCALSRSPYGIAHLQPSMLSNEICCIKILEREGISL